MAPRGFLCYRSDDMAKRISAKNAKRRRDLARAYKEGTKPAKHKVAVERSKKAKYKMMAKAV